MKKREKVAKKTRDGDTILRIRIARSISSGWEAMGIVVVVVAVVAVERNVWMVDKGRQGVLTATFLRALFPILHVFCVIQT